MGWLSVCIVGILVATASALPVEEELDVADQEDIKELFTRLFVPLVREGRELDMETDSIIEEEDGESKAIEGAIQETNSQEISRFNNYIDAIYRRMNAALRAKLMDPMVLNLEQKTKKENGNKKEKDTNKREGRDMEDNEETEVIANEEEGESQLEMEHRVGQPKVKSGGNKNKKGGNKNKKDKKGKKKDKSKTGMKDKPKKKEKKEKMDKEAKEEKKAAAKQKRKEEKEKAKEEKEKAKKEKEKAKREKEQSKQEKEQSKKEKEVAKAAKKAAKAAKAEKKETKAANKKNDDKQTRQSRSRDNSKNHGQHHSEHSKNHGQHHNKRKAGKSMKKNKKDKKVRKNNKEHGKDKKGKGSKGKGSKGKARDNKESMKESKVMGSLAGIATLRRSGDVTVQDEENHKVVTSSFTVGPLQLEVSKTLGQGKSRTVKTAKATTDVMSGTMVLKVKPDGSAHVKKVVFSKPEKVDVKGSLSDNKPRSINYLKNSVNRMRPIAAQKILKTARYVLKAPATVKQ